MSDEPVRLRDDPAMPRALREDLAAVSSAPVVYDATAGLERLQGAIRGGGGGSNGGATGGGGAATWIAGGVIVAVIAAVAIWMVARPDGAERGAVEAGATERTSTTTTTSTRPSTSTSTRTSTSTSTGTEAAREAQDESGSGAAAEDIGAGNEAQERSGPVAAARRPGDDDRYRREIAQLDEARRALGSDPGRALRLATAGQREFPRGMYGEERAAIRILALARLGRTDEARRLGEPFLRRHPQGTLSAEVRRAIGEP